MSTDARQTAERTGADRLRLLPGVDRLLAEPALVELLNLLPRETVVDAARAAIARSRAALLDGVDSSMLDAPVGAPGDAPVDAPDDARQIAADVADALRARLRPSLRRVINATGVVLHTNLGRAPVSDAAQRAMAAVAAGYSNLEYDLERGRRGSRADHLDALLASVTGAETGIAVNNNAAALYLALSAHCGRRPARPRSLAGDMRPASPMRPMRDARDVRDVIVSRGQAVEIGGGFRIPDVLRSAGARLVEVGTTNRTRAADYADALTDRTAAILRVHSSNFRIIGFASEPALDELRRVADRAGALLIDDVGSGCLLDTRQFGLRYEPRPQDSIAAGADLVMFSGDKLLGGPQAGIIVGRRAAVEPLRAHPLMRVLRPDKAAIAGLAATLRHYFVGEAVEAVPVWRMIAADESELRHRAARWRDALGAGRLDTAESPIGGGSLPGEARPTTVWSLPHPHPSRAAAALRRGEPPIIARVERDRLVLDPRAVLPDQDEQVIAALSRLT